MCFLLFSSLAFSDKILGSIETGEVISCEMLNDGTAY